MTFFANECFVCKVVDSPKICSRCNMISYCGSNHQKIDWSKHKEFCNTISFIMNEKGVSHIYEKLCDSNSDTWCKERERMCTIVKSRLDRPLHLHEEQMLLMPRSCFVCHDTRQEFLTTCPVCFCANFCEKHPSSSQHDKDCLSLKLFHDLDGKIQDPVKLRIVLALIDQIVESTKFDNSSVIPNSMKEYLDEKISSGDHVLKQACASNILSMPLTLFNTVKKLNLQSASEMLFHFRCDFPDSVVWELLLHFLPNLNFLKIIFVEQRETQTLKVMLCDDCCAKNKKLILQTKELTYKNYVKSECYNKPDIFAYLHAEISKDVEDDFEWRDLLEILSRIGCPLMLTSVTKAKSKIVSESLRSSFWPTSICYEGLNDFGALDPLREWTDGGIGKINQYMIITEGRSSQCKAGILSNHSPLLLKKKAGNSWNPQHFFYSHICLICRTEIVSVICKYCNMVFYCSESHRREDWFKHKDLCKVIQRLLIESGLKNIFDGELDLMRRQKTNSESWLQAKLNLLSKAELQLKRKLLVFEQQMFLFPKTCFACHESDLTKLQSCKCGIILCKTHKDFREHKLLCKDFELSFLLIENEQVIDPLPEYSFVSGDKEKLPNSMQDFLELHLIFRNEADVTNVQKIVIAELLTKPLTLLCAMKKLMIPKSEDNSTIVVHILDSKNAENASDEFWEVFFYWMPNLVKLSIIFLGLEIKALTFNRSYLLGHESKERNLIMKSYPLEYQQFVQSSFFIKPDIIVGYNLDIHECELGTLNCSCKENILAIKKMNIPFVMTSGTKERAWKDHKRLSAILKTSISPDFSYINSFASLEPVRDFATEGLRYSNKYVLSYSDWVQASTNKNQIFIEQASDSSRSSELEKKLAEVLFTKPKTQPTESLDFRKDQEIEIDKLSDIQVSEQEKKLNIQTENATEDSKFKREMVSKSGNRLSSVYAASSELKHMLRYLSYDSKSSFENLESKTKRNETLEDTVQYYQLEKQLEMDTITDCQTNLEMDNAKKIESDQDEDLEEKCREVFQGLLAGVEIEDEANLVENPDYQMIVKMDNASKIQVSEQISVLKEQDEHLGEKLIGKELEEKLAKVQITSEAKLVENLDYKTNMEMDNASGIGISQKVSELKEQNKDLKGKLSEKELQDITIENEANPEFEVVESKTKIETNNMNYRNVSKFELTSRETTKSKSNTVKHLDRETIEELNNAPRIEMSKPIEQDKNSEQKLLKVFPVSEKVLEEITIEIEAKAENPESNLKLRIESDTEIDTEKLNFKNISEFENTLNGKATKCESNLSIENFKQESQPRFENFEPKTEIKSMTKSSIKNAAKSTNENEESTTESTKFKREKVFMSRNAFSNILAANSELRYMLKNLRGDFKSSSLENSESKIKQNETLEAPDIVQDSQLEKQIDKIQTTKSKVEPVENPDYKINVKDNKSGTEILQQNIYEPNDHDEKLEMKLQKVPLILEKELREITIKNKTNPVENLEYESNQGVATTESKTQVETEYLKFRTKKVSKSENTFSSVLAANSELNLNEAPDVVQDSQLEKQLILTSKSEIELVTNRDYETSIESKNTLGIEIFEQSEHDKNLKEKWLHVLPVLTNGLKEITIENEVKPENLEYEANLGMKGAESLMETKAEVLNCKKVLALDNTSSGEATKSELNKTEKELEDDKKTKPVENLDYEETPRIKDTESKMVIEIEGLSCKKVSESENTSSGEAEKTEPNKQEEYLEEKLPEVFPVLQKELKNITIKNEAKSRKLESKSKPEIETAEYETAFETEYLSSKIISKSENIWNGEARNSKINEQDKNTKEKFSAVLSVLKNKLKDIIIKNEANPKFEVVESKMKIETNNINYKQISEFEIKSRAATKSESNTVEHPDHETIMELNNAPRIEMSKPIEQNKNSEQKLSKVFPVSKKVLEEITIEIEAQIENPEAKLKLGIESEVGIDTENLNFKKISVFENTSSEKTTKFESRPLFIENSGHESKSEFEQIGSKTEISTENDFMTQSSTTKDSEFANDELYKENLLLKEEIRRLKENEELVKSENLRLKEEVRRLQEEYNFF